MLLFSRTLWMALALVLVSPPTYARAFQMTSARRAQGMEKLKERQKKAKKEVSPLTEAEKAQLEEENKAIREQEAANQQKAMEKQEDRSTDSEQ